MPVLKFKVSKLIEKVGMSLDKIQEILFRLKCETEVDDEGNIYIEVNPDRPDMYSLDGIVRSVKGLMGEERGFKPPTISLGKVTIEAHEVPSRPVIAGVVLKGIKFTQDEIEDLIQFQEKLHETIGRRRRKVAIGIHDLDKLPHHEIIYTEVNIDKADMIPLYYSQRMKVREVLKRTEQGRKYGLISLRKNRHPALLSNGEIISLPPVINSDVTRIDKNTRNLFIDVTGTDLRAVLGVLNVLTCNLAYKGAIVEQVLIEDKVGRLSRTPTLEQRLIKVKPDYLNKILGTSKSISELKEYLERSRYNVSIEDNYIVVKVPPYRLDVLGPIDLVEDIAIVMGYENLGIRKSPVFLRGSLRKLSVFRRQIRDLMIGLGFTEVIQLTLTSPQTVEALKLKSLSLEVRNPVQADYSIVRPSLAASILSFLKENQHKEKPIKVFEIGRIAIKNNSEIVEDEALGMGIMDTSVSYEDIQAPLFALLRILNIDFSLKPNEMSFLLNGRRASIVVNGVEVGWLGEANPEVLEKVGIEYPVALAEIKLSQIVGEGSYRIRGL